MRNLPWYLRPSYLEGRDIQADVDGNVKAGTLAALLEWLVSDPLVEGQDKAYREVFLKTFTSFTTPDVVFESLQRQYNMSPPPNLDETQLQRWHEKRSQIQMRVLDVLRGWLEEHHMLQEDSHIALSMQEFLSQIRSPPPAAAAARQILLSMERLVVAPTFPSVSRRRGRQQPLSNVLNIDATVLAQQLTVHEAFLFSRIRPQELVRYTKDQKGPGTVHLRAFCGTSDKLAALVKSTVLELDALDKRVDALEYWIKVAHKCLGVNNISSMSAIVAALSSADLSHLSRTWTEVTSSSTKLLHQMQKYNDPNSNYSHCRQYLQTVEGPCVPFIGHPDKLNSLLSPQSTVRPFPPNAAAPAPAAAPIINFSKRYGIAQAIDAILRHQRQPYTFAEDPVTMGFLQERLAIAAAKDNELFWKRSQEIRRVEAAFGDIKRQMEWAGF
ncbi:ras GEF [Exidia glandulosa HHB12029]|uniref:Ras GEF n=1 Tax=Exidia glandulosa HHB12029 TaxID=1314781 RepID=A0A165NBC2_EXIGL|nr:ras GEF [Exidia glandulosa HHB12029]